MKLKRRKAWERKRSLELANERALLALMIGLSLLLLVLSSNQDLGWTATVSADTTSEAGSQGFFFGLKGGWKEAWKEKKT